MLARRRCSPALTLPTLHTQMNDMMSLYSNLVERCFMSCASDMTSKTLSTKESDCTRNCADKFFNMSSRCAMFSFCFCSMEGASYSLAFT